MEETLRYEKCALAWRQFKRLVETGAPNLFQIGYFTGMVRKHQSEELFSLFISVSHSSAVMNWTWLQFLQFKQCPE